MKNKQWKATEELIRLFQTVGRASLLYDIQDSHCGNMVMRWIDERGDERMAITATGSQKGDLESEHICFPSLKDTDFGYYKASSESDIHAKILALDGVNASMHCHTKDLIIETLDDYNISVSNIPHPARDHGISDFPDHDFIYIAAELVPGVESHRGCCSQHLFAFALDRLRLRAAAASNNQGNSNEQTK